MPSSILSVIRWKMGNWTCTADATEAERQQCWNDLAKYFKLKKQDNITPDDYRQKTIYFLPDYTPHPPAGITGGNNHGVLAKIPVLVK